MRDVARGLIALPAPEPEPVPGTAPTFSPATPAPALPGLLAHPAFSELLLSGLTGLGKAFATLDRIAAAQSATDRAVQSLTARLDTIPAASYRARSPATGEGLPQADRTDC